MSGSVQIINHINNILDFFGRKPGGHKQWDNIFKLLERLNYQIRIVYMSEKLARKTNTNHTNFKGRCKHFSDCREYYAL